MSNRTYDLRIYHNESQDQYHEFSYSEKEWLAGTYWFMLEAHRDAVEKFGTRLFTTTEIAFKPEFNGNRRKKSQGLGGL